MHTRPYRFSLVIALILLLGSGCNRNVAFENYNPIPEGGWHQNSLAIFQFEIRDTLNTYDLQFHIRHHIDYSYRNLWVFATIDYPDGQTTRDTIEFLIADNQGYWFGKGVGKIKENHILLSRHIRFDQPGTYTFSFQQAMREKDMILEHIQDIGLSVVRNKE